MPVGNVDGQTSRPVGTTTLNVGSPPAARNVTLSVVAFAEVTSRGVEVWMLETSHGATFATAVHANKMNVPALGVVGCETLLNGVVEW